MNALAGQGLPSMHGLLGSGSYKAIRWHWRGSGDHFSAEGTCQRSFNVQGWALQDPRIPYGCAKVHHGPGFIPSICSAVILLAGLLVGAPNRRVHLLRPKGPLHLLQMVSRGLGYPWLLHRLKGAYRLQSLLFVSVVHVHP